MAKKNAAAMEMVRQRLKKITPERRKEIAAAAAAARWKDHDAKRPAASRKEASRAKLTPEQRSAIARKAGLAGGRGRKKAE